MLRGTSLCGKVFDVSKVTASLSREGPNVQIYVPAFHPFGKRQPLGPRCLSLQTSGVPDNELWSRARVRARERNNGEKRRGSAETREEPGCRYCLQEMGRGLRNVSRARGMREERARADNPEKERLSG